MRVTTIGQVPAAAGEQFPELLLDESLDVAGDLLVEESLANSVHDLGGGRRADVSQVEELFQLIEKIAIDPTAQTEQTGDGTRSTAQIVRELSRTAEELRQSVSRFKIA